MTGEGSSVGRKLRSSASGEMSLSKDSVSISKRKQKRLNEDDDKVVPLKKKKKKHPNEEDVISVGPKTPRNRILELLENRISRSRRKGRLSIKAQPEPTASTSIAHEESNAMQGDFTFSSKSNQQVDPIAQDQHESLNVNLTPEEPDATDLEIDFQIYSNSQLEKMLHDVGVDTFGMDKATLIERCKIYHELIIPPKTNAQPEPTASTSRSHKESNDVQGDLIFSVKSNQQVDQPGSPERVSSTSFMDNQRLDGQSTCINAGNEASPVHVPSLEHGTLLYPRPRPTDLSESHSIRPKSRKGKEKERRASDSEYLPEEDEMFEDQDLEFGKKQNPKMPGMQTEVVSEDEGIDKEVLEASNTSLSIEELTKLWKETSASLVKANKRIKTLEGDFKSLSDFVRKSLGNCTGEEGTGNQPRGGRTAACIRFHLEMMFGLKSSLDPLPPPATANEQEEWNCERDLDDIVIDLDQSSDGVNADPAIDPCFPYPNGPGHAEATPQQLSVTWQLMKAAHVPSFRPNLAASRSSRENRRVWDLSERIFFKLVTLGVYTGISLDNDNISYIKRCFSTHIQTLMKRYRLQKWDDERKIRMATNVRRATRSCRLRKARSKIALQEERVWPVLSLIESVCSDDETDAEEGQDLTPGKGLICARKLSWRSMALEQLLLRLDARKGTLDQSVPKSSNSPQRGRPSRPRIRRDDAPDSLIEAPEGLPRDCYSSRFLEQLGTKGQVMLGIKPEVGISRIVQALDSH